MPVIAVARHQFFEEQQLCSYIPMPKYAKPVADNDSFAYDPKQDHYTCQAGHVLAPKHAVRSTKYYYIKKAHCQKCQWQSSCYLGDARAYIARNQYKPALERVQCRQAEPLFQQRLAERSWKVGAYLVRRRNSMACDGQNIEVWRRCRCKLT